MIAQSLLEGSSWEPAPGFAELKPKVTVILPTFRRGDNGLLKQCIDSVLAQTFKDFELIIIDDASTDSSRDVIMSYMRRDARVATIRHAKNVGLPALSVIEGFVKARATKIFFAFDDNEFLPEAMETLFNYQEQNPNAWLTYGQAEAMTLDGKRAIFGDRDFDLERMTSGNFIPNSPMLLDKRIVDDVGLFDPHISMTRLCDWDLFLRIGRKYPMSRIAKILVKEHGPMQADSLSNSHHLDMPLIREWMARDRNASLRLENFGQYDVTQIPRDVTLLAQTKIYELLTTKFKWLSGNAPETRPGYVIVASETQNFTPHARFVGLNYADVFQPQHCDLLLGASLIVGLGENQKLKALADQLGIPFAAELPREIPAAPTLLEFCVRLRRQADAKQNRVLAALKHVIARFKQNPRSAISLIFRGIAWKFRSAFRKQPTPQN